MLQDTQYWKNPLHRDILTFLTNILPLYLHLPSSMTLRCTLETAVPNEMKHPWHNAPADILVQEECEVVIQKLQPHLQIV